MALRVAEQWEQFLTAAGIPSEESKRYAAMLVTNHINKTTIPVLSNMLKVSLNHSLRLPQQPSLSRYPQCLLSPSDHHK